MVNEKKEKENILLRILKKLDTILLFIEECIGSAFFIAMAILVLINILYRFVLRLPMIWGEELSRYMMVLGVFFGVSICVRERSHLGVDFIIAMLPAKARQIVDTVISILTSFGYGLLFYLSFQFIGAAGRTGQTTPAMQLPYAYLYATICFATGLAFIRSIMVLLDDIIFRGKLFPKSKEVEGL